MTESEAIKARHSIRKYEDRPLSDADLKTLSDKIAELNKESGLRMQLVVNERKAFQSFLSYGKFSNVSNYVMVIGRKSDTIEYRAGYFGEKLVIFAQMMGLGTCFVGLTYKKIKGAYDLASDEKIAVCIAIGYPASGTSQMHKIKRPDQVSNLTPDSPEWFRRGVEAALLAPTAVNQQKFYFEHIPDNGVRPKKGSSLVGYTKIDLGIAMYNFEIGAGRDNFEWIDSPL